MDRASDDLVDRCHAAQALRSSGRSARRSACVACDAVASAMHDARRLDCDVTRVDESGSRAAIRCESAVASGRMCRSLSRAAALARVSTIVRRTAGDLLNARRDAARGQVVAATAERCGESVRLAATAVRDAAAELVDSGGGDELVAAEFARHWPNWEKSSARSTRTICLTVSLVHSVLGSRMSVVSGQLQLVAACHRPDSRNTRRSSLL